MFNLLNSKIMKSKLLHLTLLITLFITLSACSKTASDTTDTSNNAVVEKIGDDSAMFADDSGKPGKRSYDLIEDALAEKNGLSARDFTLGINKLSLTHFRGIVSGKEGVVLAAKQNDEWIIAFDGAYDVTKSYTCSSVASFNFPAEMITDCISD